MKKFIIVFLILTLAIMPAKCGYYDNFKATDYAAMKPFARDLATMLGTGAANTARPLGFSGFDIGIHIAQMPKPSADNTVLDKDKAIGLGLVQLEIGMPYRIDGFIRGNEYEGIAIAGGGLRYGLWNVSDAMYKINAALIGMANMVSAKSFYALHWNMTLVLSMNMPTISPYIAGGIDSIRLEPQALDKPSLESRIIRTNSPRLTAGLKARLGLFYMAAEASYTHGKLSLGAGSGLRF